MINPHEFISILLIQAKRKSKLLVTSAQLSKVSEVTKSVQTDQHIIYPSWHGDNMSKNDQNFQKWPKETQNVRHVQKWLKRTQWPIHNISYVRSKPNLYTQCVQKCPKFKRDQSVRYAQSDPSVYRESSIILPQVVTQSDQKCPMWLKVYNIPKGTKWPKLFING